MNPLPEHELRDLIDAVCCDALPDDLIRPLASALEHDAANRQQYFQAIALTTNIHFWLRAENSATRAIDALQTKFVHKSLEPSTVRPVVFRRLYRWTSRSALAAIAIAALTFYGTFALLVWTMSWRSEHPTNLDPTSMAQITALDQVRWSEGEAKRNCADSIAAHEPLRIDAGVIELKLKQGVTLLVQGPAQWSIDDNHAKLDSGKLIARVPQQAIGFTLKTPTATIVDLGTEFGVVADKRGTTEVQVFEGLVEIQSASSRNHTQPLRLTVGGKAVVSSSGAFPLVERTATKADIARFEWAKSSMPGLAHQLDAATKRLLWTPIALRNATATYSQDRYGIEKTIDGLLVDRNGWAIQETGETTNAQMAVWETTVDTLANRFSFRLSMLTESTNSTIGRFRISVTTDPRDRFADGKARGGKVEANWIELTPFTAAATSGATLTINQDNSVLASGPAGDGVYLITAASPLLKVTGIRLEVLTDPSLPLGTDGSGGPGRHSADGNFILTEFQIEAASASKPESVP